jgi:SAM-dependent methyltransferase
VVAPAAGELRAAVRRTAFLIQDGVLVGSAVATFDSLGLLDGKPYQTGGLPGTGYIHAAWHCLAAVGWVEPAPAQAWTDRGLNALRHRERLVAGGEFLARFGSNSVDCWARPWDAATEEAFDLLLGDHEQWRAGADTNDPLRAYLDGALVVPAVLFLRENGDLRRPEGAFARLFSLIEWLDADGRWSELGEASLEYADHCGLAGSYLPMLSRLPQLFRGELVVEPGDDEWHCQRRLNVEASGAAHRKYFTDADSIFRGIFAETTRPSYIADMGCGDGSWLAHLHGLLGDDIRYVGIDLSSVALAKTREVLIAAGVRDPLLLLGDVTEPGALRAQLADHGLAMEDGLHIRSFIDHNRTYRGGDPDDHVLGWSSGVYLAPGGSPLTAAELESDLVVHLRRWRRHVGRFGMVLIEAHSVDPRTARDHVGVTHAAALDTYHAMSHQYLVEYDAFLNCCRLAGLEPAGGLERRYPRSKPFVAISANQFTPIGPSAFRA